MRTISTCIDAKTERELDALAADMRQRGLFQSRSSVIRWVLRMGLEAMKEKGIKNPFDVPGTNK